MFIKPANWNQLSREEKRKLRLDHWEKAEGLQFESPAAEACYRERAHRLRQAYDLATPDRIIADLSMGAGEYTLRRKGLNGRALVYDHEKMIEPVIEFNREFQPDLAVNAFPYPGRTLDILDLQTYIWAGQKLPESQVIQAVEAEYMTADEYLDFAADPTAFWTKQYLPRAFGALGPMAMMPDWPRVSEIVDVAGMVIPFGLPPVQEMLKKLMAAGEAALQWASVLGQIGGTLASAGFPSMASAFVKTPFDFLGDTLRGTRGILMDMYRHPKELMAATEAYVPILIKTITQACDQMGAPVAMYPLHKGADGFMSQKQFEKFYWPPFKAVMLGLYEEGIINYLFVEGTYDSRLETIAEMPKGSALWHFDKTDMRKVKEVLSDKFTIAGNVPASLASTGSTDDMRRYCDDLVDLYTGAPGFIMAFGCGFEMT
ncbi:MAG TPA: uroporphyrinogen decarboxylase family protein, partial [Anaerolineae bacterium]